MVSLAVKPGSRKCTCTSTSPGRIFIPPSGTTSHPSAGNPSPTAAIRSPSTSTSARTNPPSRHTSAPCNNLFICVHKKRVTEKQLPFKLENKKPASIVIRRITLRSPKRERGGYVRMVFVHGFPISGTKVQHFFRNPRPSRPFFTKFSSAAFSPSARRFDADGAEPAAPAEGFDRFDGQQVIIERTEDQSVDELENPARHFDSVEQITGIVRQRMP